MYHAARSAGSWQIDQVTPHGLVFLRGLELAANGDALVAYGVVSGLGTDDELRVRRYGATPSDALVESVSNWLDLYPIGVYGGRSELEFIYTDATTIARGDGDFWTKPRRTISRSTCTSATSSTVPMAVRGSSRSFRRAARLR